MHKIEGYLKTKIFIGLAIIALLAIITEGQINLNPFDLWYKFMDWVDLNYERGGLHRLAVVAVFAFPALWYCWRKRNDQS